MAATHVRIGRPEDEQEAHLVYVLRRHECKDAFVMRAALEDPDLDMLLFPIGLVGWNIPIGIPFEVPSSSECGVCGKHLRIWAEWTGSKLFIPA